MILFFAFFGSVLKHFYSIKKHNNLNYLLNSYKLIINNNNNINIFIIYLKIMAYFIIKLGNIQLTLLFFHSSHPDLKFLIFFQYQQLMNYQHFQFKFINSKK